MHRKRLILDLKIRGKLLNLTETINKRKFLQTTLPEILSIIIAFNATIVSSYFTIYTMKETQTIYMIHYLQSGANPNKGYSSQALQALQASQQ